jgi:hypothetical protein
VAHQRQTSSADAAEVAKFRTLLHHRLHYVIRDTTIISATKVRLQLGNFIVDSSITFKMLLAKGLKKNPSYHCKNANCEWAGKCNFPRDVRKLNNSHTHWLIFASICFDEAIKTNTTPGAKSSLHSALQQPLPGAYPQQPDALGSTPLDLVTTSVVNVSALVGWIPTSISRSFLVMPFLNARA